MKVTLAVSLLSLAIASPTYGTQKPKPAPGLADLAKKADLKYFGTAIDNVVLDNKQYTNIAFNKSGFNQVTPANGQKWVNIEPSRNVFNYTLGDQIVAFNDNGTYRSDIWLDTIGPSYIEYAFKFARKYTAPGTKLYYNDYNMETVNNKTLAVQALVKDFQKRKIPIDGIGLQSHFITGASPSYQQIRDAQALYTSLGLETALTELDVRTALPDDAGKQATQATNYADAVRACVDEERCVGVTVWDFWDPVSWVPSSFPGQGDATLYNADFSRKPAYFAVAEVLRGAAR
ncbi:hypothetical protein EJ07DRAFT_164949 [Lizonia empirigonia]|nr:hypothetical protein EJ07DRAFT_164949 [Lizonia empirigonia]